MAYQDVEAPMGAFIGWGEKPGQVIEGVVTDYDPTGATNFGGDKCPALEIELTTKAHSYSKKNNAWTTFNPGELVQVTCGQVQLSKKVRKAEPRIGDKIRIELVDLLNVSNGTVKSFSVGIDHTGGGGRSSSSSSSSDGGADPWGSQPSGSSAPSASFANDDNEPPF